MRALWPALAAVAVAAVGVVSWMQRESESANVPTTTPAANGASGSAQAVTGPAPTSPVPSATTKGTGDAGADPQPTSPAAGDRAPDSFAWPRATAASRTRSGKASEPTGEPEVAVELAFQALRLVGVDAEAERTWRRAIDDPRMPAGKRSDLIEDLNQEGFQDNSHPNKADLPLVLARLELIERLLPLAKDDVNRAAFGEAYKDLLAMYVRLGGEPRAAGK
jgi:hypothetical protein